MRPAVTYFMVTGKAFLGTDFSFSFTSSVSSHFHNSNFKKENQHRDGHIVFSKVTKFNPVVHTATMT